MNHHDFRRIVLALSEAVEGAHMGHPDFRVKNRIFATIHPDPTHGMVKLTPDQQQVFVRDFPNIFIPENGAWGRAGCTRVMFSEADEELLGEVATLAWQNLMQDRGARGAKRKTSTSRRPSQKTRTRKKR
jgi:hypothetical protein